MWKDGDQHNYVMFPIYKLNPELTYSEHIQNRIKLLSAFETVGTEYGLIHLTQPDGYVKDIEDVWVERNGSENISYITCDDDNIVPVPQCSHEMITNGVYVSVSYEKKNLPNWKEIQRGVVELIQSFKAEDTARDLLFQKYVDYQSKNTKVVEGSWITGKDYIPPYDVKTYFPTHLIGEKFSPIETTVSIDGCGKILDYSRDNISAEIYKANFKRISDYWK